MLFQMLPSTARPLAQFVLTGIVLCGLSSCKNSIEEPRIRPVRALKVGDATAVDGHWFPGRAKATEEVNLAFRVGGELQGLPIKVGDSVRKGDVLAHLDPADFQASLDGAEAKLAQAIAELDAMQIARPEEIRRLQAEQSEAAAVLELAKADFERAVRIQKEDVGAISEMEVDRKKAARDRATAVLDQTRESLAIAQQGARKEDVAAKEADIRSLEATAAVARNNVKYTKLIAPFDGTISATYVDNFQTIMPQQVVCRLLDSSQIEIVVDIPESRISLAPFISDLVCVFDAFPDVEIRGVEIKEVGAEATEITRTYPVTCIMDQPDPSTGARILPGMAGRIKGTAKIPERAEEQGFAVPESAVFLNSQGEQAVWVIDERTKTIHATTVVTTQLTATGMQVTGLTAGTWIATAGVDYLTEGQEVRIQDETIEVTP